MTMKLLGCNVTDFESSNLICATRRSRGLYLPGAEPQEPIRVQVRVRQYVDTVPEFRPLRADRPDLNRLPVGALLDCYV